MDMERIHEFITLAACLNYSKAAEQLFITQPALSRHIHDLEKELGTKLFIRDTHRVHLTSIGEVFFKEATGLYEHYLQVITLTDSAAASHGESLDIAYLGTACQVFLSEFVSEFIISHPDIALSLSCGVLDKLTDRIKNGTSDVGIVTVVSNDAYHGLEGVEITRFPIFAVLHPSHPFSSHKTLALKDISGLPFINFSTQHDPIAGEYNQSLFRKAGAKCNIVKEVENMEEGIFLASIGQGIFFMPEFLLNIIPDTLCVIPLSDKHCYVTLNLIWKRSNLNPAMQQFISEFRVFMENHYQ